MHRYSDNWPYFLDVDNAAYDIGSFLRKWGRVEVRDAKEKWGTVRVYCNLGWNSLHSITHPGYTRYAYPTWLIHLDQRYLSGIINHFNPIIVPYHEYLYRKAYMKAIKKYPHIKQEILQCADFSHLLEGL